MDASVTPVGGAWIFPTVTSPASVKMSAGNDLVFDGGIGVFVGLGLPGRFKFVEAKP